MMVYFENISLKVFMYSLMKGYVSYNRKTNKSIYYFIDANKTIINIINSIGKLLNFEFKQLEFKMTQIIDTEGEMVPIRMARKDLFEFEKIIRASKAYKELYHSSWTKSDLELFIIKGLLGPSIQVLNYPQRMLYLINVINWHMKKINIDKSEFVVSNRPWFDEYTLIAKRFSIQLHKINKNKLPYRRFLTFFSKIIKTNTRLLIIGRNIQNKIFCSINNERFKNEPLLYLEGRGGVNFENNGKHSDFFWQLNSEFLTKNILYKNSKENKDVLIANGVQIMDRKVKYFKTSFTMPIIGRTTTFKKEREEINSQLLYYKSTREYWRCLFKTYNVKIFLTWYIFENDHFAKNDAIKDVGGVSVVQQIAFDGYKTYTCSKIADVVLRYSKWNCDLEKELNSKINYKIITGYPKDYATPLLKKEASLMREKLKKNGAKKIVFVIDENSGYDDRWHTGHGLQRENYSFILNKMMETPWLGVIFKPKYVNTLRRRLGNDIWSLLKEAVNTGRCHIYNESDGFATIAPPILGGLSADICIHGHMGNAALECALSNLPTLIIDRERNPHHKFRELPENKVVFNNWPDTITALMEHFNRPKGISGFGDWSYFVDQFDPFRDGKSAYRIGTFKKWLLDGFNEGKNREIVLKDAVDRYAEIWGNDKVIFNNN